MWSQARQGWPAGSRLERGTFSCSRRRVALGLARVTALALALSGALCATSQATITYGSFGGYQRYGPVHSLHAAWPVPRVRGAAPTALASTWVGAQAARPGSAFIQVGTDEGCVEVPCGAEGVDGFDYFAFWSDTAHGDHPQRLFDIGPGDLISARLERLGGAWRVSIADETRRVRARVNTNDETAGTLELAEWTQEDPVLETGGIAPYPALEDVEFSHVEVNGLRPSYNRLYSTWMSAGGSNLAPTPLQDGAFTLAPAPPLSAEATAVLVDCAEADEAQYAFDDALAGWSGASPRAVVIAGAEHYAAALASEFAALTTAPLGPVTPTQRRALLVALGGLRFRVRAIATTPALSFGAWRRHVLIAEERVSAARHVIARALALPEVVAPGLVLGSAS